MLFDEGVQAQSFRLAPQQEAYWAFAGGGTPAVVQCAAAVGALSDELLQRALEALVDRHEALRTTFVRQAGMRLPSQVIRDEVQASFASATETVPLQTLLDDEARFTFDMEAGPVLRALVADTDAGRMLLLAAPAPIADSVSLGRLALDCIGLASGVDGEADEPLQYADYAEWRHELIGGDNSGAHEARSFWEEQLARSGRVTPPLLFGADARETEPWRTGRIAVNVPSDIEAISSSAGVDTVVFLEAAWHALVARLGRHEEVTIASGIEARSAEELTNAIGAFSMLALISTRYEDATSFFEVLDQVRRDRVDAAAWIDSQPGSVACAIVRAQPLGWVASVAAAGVDAIRASAPFALQLEARSVSGGWEVEVVYDPEAYSARDTEVIGRSYSALLAAAAADPTTAVALLPLVDADERERLLTGFSGTEVPVSREPVHRLFERQARRVPERTAVAADGGTLTYHELDETANRVADLLRGRGIGRNVPVGLCMDRSLEMVESLMGILKAGGAYLPLNFEHPPARLLHQLQESGSPLVLTQAAHVDAFSDFGGEVIAIDAPAVREDLEGRASSGNSVESEPDDLLYLMYTSGSTGMPKGVAVTHGNVANYTAYIAEKLGASEEEGHSFALVTAISTDLGNTSLFPALCSGGTLHLVSPETAMDGNLYARYTAEHPIDVLKITPSHLTALLNGAQIDAILPRCWLVTGGEALPWTLATRVLESGRCRLLNHYGPTETTIGSCTFDVGDDASAWRPRTVPIGRPIDNTRVYILERRLEPVPVGAPGELCIGGAGVSQGYVEQPEQTEASFVPGPNGQGRCYCTGDLARMLPDGNIEFLGRADEQAKIRGFRVEPAEIEAVLSKYESVRQAAVVLNTGQADPRLVAYIVAAQEPNAADLRRFLADTLPEYMIPTQFVRLDALPFSASGKLDRRALPDPTAASLELQRDYVPPRTPLEEELAAIWADVLGVELVGVTDDFFSLGGHSLLATQIVARIRTTLGVDLPLHVIFLSPTIEGLAQEIIGLGSGAAGDTGMAALLDEIESLSDEEVRQTLASEQVGRDEGV